MRKFDPATVERIDHTDTFPGEYVRASDYDQLLALYRKLSQAFADSIEARSKGL